jgi:hypothetical protein
MADDHVPSAPEPRRPRGGNWWWVVGLAIAALVVILLAPLASPDPDGLEAVAEDQGFLGAARDALFQLLPDYTLPGIEDPTVSTIASGLIGVLVVFAVMVAAGWLLRRRRAT